MNIRTIMTGMTSSAVTVLAFSPSLSSAAEGLSYTYIEGNYIVQDIDLYEDNDLFDNFLEDFDDGDGWGIHGSFAFHENWFVEGSWTTTESDFDFIDATGALIPQGEDVETLRIGLGFNMPMTDRVDLVARAQYVDVDLGDFNFGADENELDGSGDLQDAFNDLNDDDSDGYSLDLGARGQLLPWLEAGLGVRYIDLDYGDDVSIFGNLLFEFTPGIGIILRGDFADEISTYSAGLRFSF